MTTRSRAFQSRRSFLRISGGVAAALMQLHFERPIRPAEAPKERGEQPWYRRTFRWGQTNLAENDPPTCDVAWWREYWKRTRTQGVIINAGGIVAYYPSRYPLHQRANL